jgi:hypothetical protein
MGTGAQTGDAIYCVTVTGFDGEAELRASDLRALLLAYQERGRTLEPFAAVADKCPENWPDQTTPGLVTLGDCRRARATLKGKSYE